jgi:hypothetical protein
MQCSCTCPVPPLLIFYNLVFTILRARKKTLVELLRLLVLILPKNGNGGYKTQHRFLGMLYGLLNNQQAVSSFASPASRGA